MKSLVHRLDCCLLDDRVRPALHGMQRSVTEFLYFGVKQARACLFAGLFFAAVVSVPRAGLCGVPRYDVLLLFAVGIQLWMVRAGLESLDELKAICLFHIVGLVMELFKTSAWIGSWSYPDDGWFRLLGVPLFSGFMYAAVGSYVIQAWRLFKLRIHHHPSWWMASGVAALIYVNFFTHHFLPDMRWYLVALVCGLYARTMVIFRPLDRDRRMPLLLSFVLIGLFVWIAENISTFLRVWQYPHQMGTWAVVHAGKWTSWSLLVIMTFTIVAHLKHIKESVHVPK